MAKHQKGFRYLKPKQYYIDLHDIKTIGDCLYYYRSLHKKLPEAMKLPNKEDRSEERLKNDWLRMMNIVIHSIKTQRFKDKKKTVEKWKENDREKEEMQDNTEPGEFYCVNCEVLLEDIHKDLHDRTDEALRVLFMYECPKCSKREAYSNDGKKYVSKPTLCDKCGGEVDVSIDIDDKKDITTWTYRCTGCDYEKVDVDDHKKWRREQADKEKKDKRLLNKFRKEFCFTEEEGSKAVQWIENLKSFTDDMKKDEKKRKDPAYQKAINLKKLKVVELNKLLKEVIPKQGYIELQFEKPDMGRFVAVPFVVQDEKSDREEYEEYDSRKQLKKLVNKALEGTNWRLMSDGVSYRVGYLSGRLRCYENEKDLMALVQ